MTDAAHDAASSLRLVLPDVDVLVRCFTRRHPDLSAIKHFQALVAERRLFLLGWVRQIVLERCVQETQLKRFAQQLAAFPDLHIVRADYEVAAELRLLLRDQQIRASSRQLFLWALAKRLDADIWSYDKSWLALRVAGCPLNSNLMRTD